MHSTCSRECSQRLERFKSSLTKMLKRSAVYFEFKCIHCGSTSRPETHNKINGARVVFCSEQCRIARRNKTEMTHRQRRKTRIQWRLAKRLRNRLREMVGQNKCASALELVGCSLEQLKAHLESQFQPGMTWENAGFYGWHIDHIIPCAAFDLTKPEEQAKCFHYTNLQPLWRKQNQSKSSKCVNKPRESDGPLLLPSLNLGAIGARSTRDFAGMTLNPLRTANSQPLRYVQPSLAI